MPSFMPKVGGRFTSVVSTFMPSQAEAGEQRWIGKSALTAVSSDASSLLISL